MRFAVVTSSGCLATVLHDVANQSLGKAGGDRVRVQRLAVAFQQLRYPTAFFGAVATGLRTFGHVFVVRGAFAGLGASRATSGAALWKGKFNIPGHASLTRKARRQKRTGYYRRSWQGGRVS